jgi:MFS family permease
MFLGWFLGAPAIGWISHHVRNRKSIMTGSAIAGFVIMSCFLAFPGIPHALLAAMAFLYGITNTGLILAYAAAGAANPKKYTGTALAFANISSVIVGVCLQPMIGKVLDLTWDGTLNAMGNRIFDPFYFRISMIILPLCFLAALVICLCYIKEENLIPLED